MLKSLLHRLIRQRHFWREVGFDELTELYISNMLRTFAVSLLAVFLPYYLHQNGYSFSAIFAFYGLFFVGRSVADIAAGYFVARYGPKHAIIISCILQTASSALLLTLPDYHWPSWFIAPLYGASASFFFIAYHVEFSKIKHTNHAGKELGEMQIFDRAATIAGPLMGGLVGAFWGPQYIFAIACVVLFASLWPLFRTPEQVRQHQRIDLRSVPIARLGRDYVSYVALGLENTLCINLWPMYLALFALGGSVYASLGILSSLAVVVSMVAAYFFGRHIDTRNARSLLRFMAFSNAVVYLWRPFVMGPLSALLTNVINEAVTTGYRMPYLKGMYAAADDLPGLRIAYIMTLEWMGTISKGTVWFVLAILAAGGVPGKTVIFIGFMLAGLASLLIATERFRALNTSVRR